MVNKILILAISFVVISSNFQAVSAEIFFPSTNVRLDGPSEYCIISPKDELVENKKTEWIRLTENAVLDWEENLKEAEFENDDIWEMNVNLISESNDESCDIIIEFKDKPSLSDTVAGFFSWPPGKIVVYYLQPKVCNGVLTCYDDETLKSDDTIFAILIHEIGHSLGLDHYVSDDNDINKKWQTGTKNPPSVMIPTIPRIASLLEITDIDIQKVREIYGTEGFHAFSGGLLPSPQPGPTPEPTPQPKPEPIIPLSPITGLGISQKVIEADRYDRQIVTLSGSIQKEEYHRGLPVILTIHNPDDSVQVLKISTTGVGYFETILIFNNESLRGIYRVSASYLGHVDKNMDITFEVIDKNLDLPKTKSPSNPQVFDDSQSEKPLSSDGLKIPTWIKNNANWWASEQIGDHAFVSGIQFLIEQDIIQIPDVSETASNNLKEMPKWIKNIAGYWANDSINDDEFIKSIQYLIRKGIIVVS
ncbi:MAG: hypothetical protein OEM79_06740 [Nitrosopumilus sp.]|nr:hypothetical protein [Nitrosopumilus sp.]